MRTLWILAVLLLGVEGNLVQFELLIMKVAKRSGLLSYSAYGCYCGWGGHGRPQDATDRCCFVHDCCYGKVTDCNPKTASYTYSEENGEIVCGGDDPCKKQAFTEMRLSHVAMVLGVSMFALTASSLLNFKLMIQRITQKNVLVHFNGYGCYCGKGGRGKPRDPTDMCCYNHDCCYENLHHQNCHPFIDHYRYLIINNSVLCKYKNRSVCATLACECDKHASLCFKREAPTYNRKLRHYPTVLCKESTPKCFPGPEF